MLKLWFNGKASNIKEISKGLFARSIQGMIITSRHLNTLKNTFDNIFIKEIYNFQSKRNSPFIIDGGANIGLACLFWKSKYPLSEILAFEPSQEVYHMLLDNLRNNNIDNVRALPYALYHCKAELEFGTNEGLSGSLILEKNLPRTYMVRTDLLSNYIDKPVDLLKLDIEGAEWDVLGEIENKLHFVDRLFVEYHSFENKPQELSELLGLLQRHGFRYHLSSEYEVASPFMGFKRSLSQDLQVNIWAVKESLL